MSKKEVNPLMKRLGIKPTSTGPKSAKTNPKKQTNKSDQNNPLLQALKNGAAKTLTLSDRIRPVNGKQAEHTAKNRLQKKAVGKVIAARVTKPVKQAPQKQQKQQPVQIGKGKGNGNGKDKKQLNTLRASKHTTVLQIKKSTQHKFLRVKNLVIGTSAQELRDAIQSMGTIKDIRVQDLASGSTTAEVMFDKESELMRALNDLNGAWADGRVLHAEISTEHQLH